MTIQSDKPQAARSLRHRFHQVLPVLVSVGLVIWLVGRVSPAKLLAAAAELNWTLLLLATVGMVVGLYLWDGVCLQTVYSLPQFPVTYRQSLHLRGTSYLAGAFNYELGHAVLAWGMARLQGTSLMSALSRSLLLLFHDIFVLLGLGLFGALLADDPRAIPVRAFCSVGLVLLLLAVSSPWWLAGKRRQQWKTTRWGAWLDSWSWGRSLRLVFLRGLYFLILILYAAVALAICRVSVDHAVVFSTIPMVMLADGLPSISGLGTRETAMLTLLKPEREEVILALCLIWSATAIFGRFLIGLAHFWIPRLLAKSATL